jgi:integrase
VLRRPIFTGFGVLSCFTTNAILKRWNGGDAVFDASSGHRTSVGIHPESSDECRPFLYRVVLQQDLVGIDAVRAKRSRYLPTVLTPDEAQRVIHHLYGVYKLVIQLLYGIGLRLVRDCSCGLKISILLSIN